MWVLTIANTPRNPVLSNPTIQRCWFNSSLIGDGAERFNQRHGVRRRYAHCDYYSSEAITLRSGDVIVTGTPSGVGLSRKPLFMKAGDTVEVEIERIGILANPIVNET